MGSIESYLKVLVVEDDDSLLTDWEDAVAAHNADFENKGFKVEYIAAKSVPQAKRLLELHSFDAAIVDLRLQLEDGAAENNTHGNHLVVHILETHPLGIVIHTGQRADADVPAYAVPQISVLDKGDGLDPIFEWLEENKDLFLKLRGAKSIFNRETAKMFFKSIWPRWKIWAEGGDQQKLTDVVARHVIAHIHDSLLAASNDATHSEEAYFVPPLKERLDTGDLVSLDEKIWVVVTPRCDLANAGKVKTIVLAACEDISAEWAPLNVQPVSKTSEDKIKKIIQHRSSHKQHFLFPLVDLNAKKNGPWMVNFDEIMSIPFSSKEQLEQARIASLSPLFVPSLVERFGAYFSRIGTPGYSSD